MKPVAIIGGGWAGLACAVELADAGVPVCVLEAARTLGGRARRVAVEGLAVDNGQHLLVGAYRDTLALIRRVGGQADDFLRLPLDLYLPGHLRLRAPRLPAPLHLLAALAGARGLGPGGRRALLRLLGLARLRGFRLDPDRSVDQWLHEQRQPAAVRRLLLEPLCLAALNTPPAQASAQVFLNVLRDSLMGRARDADLLLPRRDLSAIFPDRAARHLAARGSQVLTGVRVTGLEARADGFALYGSGVPGDFARVVCATAPRAAARLLAPLPALAGVVRELDALQYQPIVTVYLQYDPGTRLPAPMTGLCDGIAQWAFDRGVLGGQAGLLGVVISADGAHRALSHAALAARVHEELRALLPCLPAPRWHQVIAERQATFACTVDLRRAGCRLPLAGLYLAGDHVRGDYPATLESAVRSGRACAAAVLADLQREPAP